MNPKIEVNIVEALIPTIRIDNGTYKISVRVSTQEDPLAWIDVFEVKTGQEVCCIHTPNKDGKIILDIFGDYDKLVVKRNA